MKFMAVMISLIMATVSMANAQVRTPRNNQEKETPPVYTDGADRKFSALSIDDISKGIHSLTEQQEIRVKEAVKRRDSFLYDAPNGLSIENSVIHVNPRFGDEDRVPVIELGHNYTTTLVFVDKAGRPWSVEMLTDISSPEVFSVVRKQPHIITVRALKRAGEANLPLILKGQQYPFTVLFKVSDKKSVFTMDIMVDGLGDNSQSDKAMVSFNHNGVTTLPPRYDTSDTINKMVQGITPSGFNVSKVYDDYANQLSDTDIMAWRHDEKLYVLTHYTYYSPTPSDVHASPDGYRFLYVFGDVPFLNMRHQNKIIQLNIQ